MYLSQPFHLIRSFYISHTNAFNCFAMTHILPFRASLFFRMPFLLLLMYLLLCHICQEKFKSNFFPNYLLSLTFVAHPSLSPPLPHFCSSFYLLLPLIPFHSLPLFQSATLPPPLPISLSTSLYPSFSPFSCSLLKRSAESSRSGRTCDNGRVLPVTSYGT